MEFTLFILGLIQIGFCCFNLGISFISYQKSTNKILLILGSSFIIVFLNGISIIIISIFDFPTNELSYLPYIAYQLFGITGIATFFITYLFLELLNHDRPPLFRFLYFSTFFTGYLFMAFIPSNYYFYYDETLGIYNFEYNYIIQILIFSFLISVFIYYIITLWQIRKLSEHKIQKRAIHLLFIGLCIIVIGLIIPTIINHREWILIFNSIGLFLLGLSFYQYPNIVFLNPSHLLYLIITNKDGRTLYSQEFQDKFTDIDDILVGGALNALSVVFMKIFKSSHGFNQIKMKDHVILFQTMEEISVGLIVRQSSFLLQNTLYSFSRALIKKYKQKIKNWDGILDDFEGIAQLISQYFPFINK